MYLCLASLSFSSVYTFTPESACLDFLLGVHRAAQSVYNTCQSCQGALLLCQCKTSVTPLTSGKKKQRRGLVLIEVSPLHSCSPCCRRYFRQAMHARSYAGPGVARLFFEDLSVNPCIRRQRRITASTYTSGGGGMRRPGKPGTLLQLGPIQATQQMLQHARQNKILPMSKGGGGQQSAANLLQRLRVVAGHGGGRVDRGGGRPPQQPQHGLAH